MQLDHRRLILSLISAEIFALFLFFYLDKELRSCLISITMSSCVCPVCKPEQWCLFIRPPTRQWSQVLSCNSRGSIKSDWGERYKVQQIKCPNILSYCTLEYHCSFLQLILIHSNMIIPYLRASVYKISFSFSS